MNRTLKLSIMLALAMGGGPALAQSLGPVQMRSTMEQPLLADIPLTGVSGGLDTVHVSLASDEAFSRAGLNRGGLPVELTFSVTKNASGQPVIRVSSSAPVRDTYLDFLVEVSSGGGNKVVREVTMLLDPPGTPISAPTVGAPAPTDRPSRTSDVPARASVAGEPRSARSEMAPRTPAAVGHARSATPSDGRIGPIQRGQSLSAIARDHANGADMNQMLLALRKANPDAFYRDNINALKTGAVLRVPSTADVQAQSVASALAEVRRQNEEWRSGATRKPSVVADGAASGATRGHGNDTAPSSDRLALVPSKDGGDAAATRAGTKDGKGDAQVAGLKQELATQQENVASLKQQSAELTSRVGDLEAINGKNQRLLSLKDAEIAELQRKLAETRKAGGEPVAAATVPTSAATAAPAAVAPSASAAAAVAVPVAAGTTAASKVAAAGSVAAPAPVAPSTAAGAKPPVTTPVPVAPTPVEEDPWYMQPWVWGGGTVVILLLLVAAVFGRKKPKPVAPAAASLADRFDHEPTLGDYGHNDAIDTDQREILDALSEHPDDIGLHLELVSLYYGRRDVDHFEAAAEAMFAHVADPDQPEWRDVVAMGEDLAPTHPLFGGTPVDDIDAPYDTYTAGTPPTADEAGALEAFDLGNYVTGPDEEEAAESSAPQKHSEYHFNFDLTPVQRDEAEHRPQAPDVFDVDAPASPYAEAPIPADPNTVHASTFGDILDEQVRSPQDGFSSDLPTTWSFEDDHELAGVTPTEVTPAEPTSPESFAPFDAPRFDEPRLDEPRFDELRLDEPRFDEPAFADDEPLTTPAATDSFSDDPVDTKLDLARAYLDMGDAEGARLMLDEVIAEGTQMQKDTARRILDDIV